MRAWIRAVTIAVLVAPLAGSGGARRAAPIVAPPGLVVVKVGESVQAAVERNPPGTRFLLESGTHRQQTIAPKSGSVFTGETGAVLDGLGVARVAFAAVDGAAEVTIARLTITNYASPRRGGAVEGEGGVAWTVSDCEISYGHGVGVRMGRRMRILRNNIHHNRHSGIDGTRSDSALVEGNTIAANGTAREVVDGAVADVAGMKIYKTRGVVVRDNVVRDNWGPGIWFDTDNVGALIAGNTVARNSHRGIFYEISYAGVIRDNVIERNGFGVRPTWVSNAGIFVVSSPDVEVSGNRVRRNRHGITAGQTSVAGGAHGPYVLRNLYVHDNEIVMADGLTGVDEADGSDAVFSRNNVFARNRYVLGARRNYFLWRGKSVDERRWRRFGQDVTGTFRR